MTHVTVDGAEPLWREIAYEEPAGLAARLKGRPYLTFLDSALRAERLGRYSYLACDPVETVMAEGDEPGEDVLKRLMAALQRRPARHRPDLPPFQGGFAGYIAYEFGRLIEPHVKDRIPSPTLPALMMHGYDAVVAFDHVAHRACIISTGYPEGEPDRRQRRARARLDEMQGRLAAPPSAPSGDHRIARFSSNFTRAAYEAAVRRTVEYILAGDIFQANISQKFTASTPAGFDPFAFYQSLRRRNAATFAAFLDYGEVVIASSSPERLVSFDGELAEARPIKGTRRRDPDPHADAALKAELLASRKDRAENVMIVDLLRNDLSRVCDPGTVDVPALCGLESYASVHHLVSAVTGRLSPGKTATDLIAACFPGGSITGAPKLRAMEIIGEIEQAPRNIYCGSIGFLSFSGSMDLSIAIRTVLFHHGQATFQGGGGITARSDPAAEYEETLAKVGRILESFEAGAPP